MEGTRPKQSKNMCFGLISPKGKFDRSPRWLPTSDTHDSHIAVAGLVAALVLVPKASKSIAYSNNKTGRQFAVFGLKHRCTHSLLSHSRSHILPPPPCPQAPSLSFAPNAIIPQQARPTSCFRNRHPLNRPVLQHDATRRLKGELLSQMDGLASATVVADGVRV